MGEGQPCTCYHACSQILVCRGRWVCPFHRLWRRGPGGTFFFRKWGPLAIPGCCEDQSVLRQPPTTAQAQLQEMGEHSAEPEGPPDTGDGGPCASARATKAYGRMGGKSHGIHPAALFGQSATWSLAGASQGSPTPVSSGTGLVRGPLCAPSVPSAPMATC